MSIRGDDINAIGTDEVHSSCMISRLDVTGRLQRRIVEIATTALPLIGKTTNEADLAGLTHLRGEMIAAVSAYARHVRALQAAGTLQPQELQALVESCSKLDKAYQAFRSRWVDRNRLEHWHEYRLSAAVMMKQIRALVQPVARSGL